MKSSTKWFLAIAGALVLIGLAVMSFFLLILSNFSDGEEVVRSGSGGRVALVELEGVITDAEEIVRQLKKHKEDKSIKGIVLRVDSPGGGVVASQEIYEAVKSIREMGKPIVVSMGALAASGGYYVACGASRVVANRGTLTGSIGVISQFMRFDPFLDKVGVDIQTIKSGKFKDAGNPFREMSPDDKKYFQELMDDVHRQFITVVETERSLDHDTLARIADGRVFTGEQAIGLGLVDTLGTLEDAILITADLAGITGKPTVIKERKRRFTLLDALLGEAKVSDLLGLKDELLSQPILQYKMTPGF